MPESNIMTLFVENVRACLAAYRWTARDLCDATGIHESNMSLIMSGKEGVSLKRAAIIAAALEIPLSSLLSENFEIEPLPA